MEKNLENAKTVCFEIYTINPETKETGWDIENVEVIAETMQIARKKIQNYPLFDCVITTNDWFHMSEKSPLWDGEKLVKRLKK